MAKDVRLQKMLADCGVASRRKAEEMIANGRVKVNGRVAKIGDKVDTKKDKITVDNKTVVSSVRSVYYMLHKPRGFITTMSDEMGRKCVAELVADIPERFIYKLFVQTMQNLHEQYWPPPQLLVHNPPTYP